MGNYYLTLGYYVCCPVAPVALGRGPQKCHRAVPILVNLKYKRKLLLARSVALGSAGKEDRSSLITYDGIIRRSRNLSRCEKDNFDWPPGGAWAVTLASSTNLFLFGDELDDFRSRYFCLLFSLHSSTLSLLCAGSVVVIVIHFYSLNIFYLFLIWG